MNQEIKIGDFIKGAYKFGCICGVVKKINKNSVVIEKHSQDYNHYKPTNNLVNVTKSRISSVGLEPNEIIIY